MQAVKAVKVTVDSIDVAKKCAQIASDKRATDLLILEIGPILAVADYFVFATVRNKRQLKAIANGIRVELKEDGVRDIGVEGHGTERWLLLDYGDVVVHIFDQESRAYYDLESLWADARRVELGDLDAPSLAQEAFEDDFPV